MKATFVSFKWSTDFPPYSLGYQVLLVMAAHGDLGSAHENVHERVRSCFIVSVFTCYVPRSWVEDRLVLVASGRGHGVSQTGPKQ